MTVVLVIGRKGQVAQALARLSSRRAVKIIAKGRPYLDLLQRDKLSEAIASIKPDIIVNAAGYTAVDKAEVERDLAFATNARGVGYLGAIAAANDIPVIHLSTDYVFDGAKASPYVEGDPVSPINVYGRSKLAGEQRLVEANPRHIVLRTAWLHSPFGHNFVTSMLELGKRHTEICVVDDQYGNPTYALHLSAAILKIIKHVVSAPSRGDWWGIYHLAGSGEASRFGLAEEVFKCAASQGLSIPKLRAISTAAFPSAARRPLNSRLDSSRLYQTFGVQLPHWTEGVHECVTALSKAAPPHRSRDET